MVRIRGQTALLGIVLLVGCHSAADRVAADSAQVRRVLPGVDSGSLTAPVGRDTLGLPDHTGDTAAVNSADSAKVRYWSFAERFARSRSQLIAGLGPPTAISGRAFRNEDDSTVTDSMVTLTFRRGFAMEFFVGGMGNEFPSAVSVTDSTIGLPLSVGIGAHKADLEHYFGEPSFEGARGDSTQIQFTVPCDDCAGRNELVFFLLDKVVRKVEWSFFID